MTIKNGDFVLLNYAGKTNGRMFDTNIENIAKEGGVFVDHVRYRPLLVCAGAKDLIVGLDKELEGMKKGDKKHVVVKPIDGYGERNPDLVKIIPLQQFKKNNIQPAPGLVLELDGHPARIQSVSGGRVRVDFNHELAGKELEFDMEVMGVITKKNDQITALVQQYFDKDKVTVAVTDKKVTITPSKEAIMEKEYGKAKAYTITQITGRFKEMNVSFVEEFGK